MTELVTRQDLQTAISSLETRLEAKIDTLTLRLTVQLGGIMVAGLGALAFLIRLH
ncbi:MAG: hypothetical protein QOH32_123 [Bradyrhizobium sp.]|jgi:hypothetical protein|nr:hypothetical protein [Bradyrhizobium sp.]